MGESTAPITLLLGSIFPLEKFPLRARTTFPVLDDLDDHVPLTRTRVPHVEPKRPARVRATVVAYYQRPLEIIHGQAHGFYVQIDFLHIAARFKFVRRCQLGVNQEFFLNEKSIEFRCVPWSEFVRSANLHFESAELQMRIETFLDRSLNVALAEGRWGGCSDSIE
jgi:hypothetical protein